MSSKKEFYDGLYRTMTDTDDEGDEDDFASFVAKKVKEHAAKKVAKARGSISKPSKADRSATVECPSSDSLPTIERPETSKDLELAKDHAIAKVDDLVKSGDFMLPSVIQETPPSSPYAPMEKPVEEVRKDVLNRKDEVKVNQSSNSSENVPYTVTEDTPRDSFYSSTESVQKIRETPLPVHLQLNYVSSLEELENLSRPRGRPAKAPVKKRKPTKEPQLPEPYRNLFRGLYLCEYTHSEHAATFAKTKRLLARERKAVRSSKVATSKSA